MAPLVGGLRRNETGMAPKSGGGPVGMDGWMDEWESQDCVNIFWNGMICHPMTVHVHTALFGRGSSIR